VSYYLGVYFQVFDAQPTHIEGATHLDIKRTSKWVVPSIIVPKLWVAGSISAEQKNKQEAL